ncbi:hypothetical protein LCGC14_0159970 [marine sediment metagenome]|uniref:Uncharacterized protein n=1 Tax=marine sediment metagenome TaxID=412755 RepID=A0A0F9UVG8_9ZZZZ
MDGCCQVCREKREDESDFEEAKKEGKITRNDSIMCPYCGYVLENDSWEYNDSKEFDCPECDKKSELSVEYTPHYTTTKIDE